MLNLTTRRITGTDTIPTLKTSIDGTALTGTVTTSSSDTKVLLYAGTDDLAAIFIDAQMYRNGNRYIYVAGSGFRRVIACNVAQGAYTFALLLDTAMGGIVTSAFSYVIADLLQYSWLNDGGSNATIDSIVMPTGTRYADPQLAPSGSRTDYKEPVLVVAAGTSVLVTETK